MLTDSISLAQLLLLLGLVLGAWSYRNLLHPPPQLAGKYSYQYAILIWAGFGVAVVLLVYGGASIAQITF